MHSVHWCLFASALVSAVVDGFGHHHGHAHARVSATARWAGKFKVTDWASSVDGGEFQNGRYLTDAEVKQAKYEETKAAKELATRTENALRKRRVELFVSAGPDGTPDGSPDTHFVRAVLAAKRLDYVLTPCSPGAGIPAWLAESYGGALPCLLHDGEAHTSAATVAK